MVQVHNDAADLMWSPPRFHLCGGRGVRHGGARGGGGRSCCYTLPRPDMTRRAPPAAVASTSNGGGGRRGNGVGQLREARHDAEEGT